MVQFIHVAFPETLKVEVRKKADMRCCVCHAIGVEIHHIIPLHEGGEDSLDNAAPLCPSCHETYGENPTKRKFIREARDNWFNLCIESLSTTHQLTTELLAKWESFANRIEGSASRHYREENLSLGGFLAVIYNGNTAYRNLDKNEVDFLYDFFYGRPTDAVFDTAKTRILHFFGRETARRCLAYLADKLNIRTKHGFTKDELSELASEFQLIATILTTLHEEMNEDGGGVVARLRDDGELIFHPRDREPD